jgi:hypothetical protein
MTNSSCSPSLVEAAALERKSFFRKKASTLSTLMF